MPDALTRTPDAILLSLLRTLAAASLPLRDQFAKTAMHAMVIKTGGANAQEAYRIADELLRARAGIVDEEPDDEATP